MFLCAFRHLLTLLISGGAGSQRMTRRMRGRHGGDASALARTTMRTR